VWLDTDSIIGCLICLSVDLKRVYRQAWFPLAHINTQYIVMYSKLRCSFGARRGEREGSVWLLPEAILSRHDITPQIRNLIGTNEHFQFTGSSIQIGKTRRKWRNVEIKKYFFVENISLYTEIERAYIFTFRYFLYAPVILEMMMQPIDCVPSSIIS